MREYFRCVVYFLRLSPRFAFCLNVMTVSTTSASFRSFRCSIGRVSSAGSVSAFPQVLSGTFRVPFCPLFQSFIPASRLFRDVLGALDFRFFIFSTISSYVILLCKLYWVRRFRRSTGVLYCRHKLCRTSPFSLCR